MLLAQAAMILAAMTLAECPTPSFIFCQSNLSQTSQKLTVLFIDLQMPGCSNQMCSHPARA